MSGTQTTRPCASTGLDDGGLANQCCANLSWYVSRVGWHVELTTPGSVEDVPVEGVLRLADECYAAQDEWIEGGWQLPKALGSRYRPQ